MLQPTRSPGQQELVEGREGGVIIQTITTRLLCLLLAAALISSHWMDWTAWYHCQLSVVNNPPSSHCIDGSQSRGGGGDDDGEGEEKPQDKQVETEAPV